MLYSVHAPRIALIHSTAEVSGTVSCHVLLYTFEGAKLLATSTNGTSLVPISRSCLKLFKFLYIYTLYIVPTQRFSICRVFFAGDSGEYGSLGGGT